MNKTIPLIVGLFNRSISSQHILCNRPQTIGMWVENVHTITKSQMFQSQLMFLPNIGDEIFDVVEPLLEPTASYCGSMSPLCCQEHVKYYVPSCSHFEDCWKRKNQHSQSVCVVIGTSSSSGTLVSKSMVRKPRPHPSLWGRLFGMVPESWFRFGKVHLKERWVADLIPAFVLGCIILSIILTLHHFHILPRACSLGW